MGVRKLGLAIRVPKGTAALRKIRKDRGVFIFQRPMQALPGSRVVFVGPGGAVEMMARLRSISGEDRGYLLGMKGLRKGYWLRLKGLEEASDGQILRISWHAVGQFRYFDTRTWKAVVLGPGDRRDDGVRLEDDKEGADGAVARGPFEGGIPNLPRDNPEARLVDAYVEWVGGEGFESHYLSSQRLYPDLFDASRWRLIEAKVSPDRKALRMALGQLLDYRRAYARSPSLGVLLGSRPSRSGLAFLADCGVTALWRTPTGQFRDSTATKSWTAARRPDRGR